LRLLYPLATLGVFFAFRTKHKEVPAKDNRERKSNREEQIALAFGIVWLHGANAF
jgi:hypothetical protein